MALGVHNALTTIRRNLRSSSHLAPPQEKTERVGMLCRRKANGLQLLEPISKLRMAVDHL